MVLKIKHELVAIENMREGEVQRNKLKEKKKNKSK